MKTLYAKCSKTHQACDETLCITVSRPVVLHMHGVVEEQSDVCFCAWRCFAKWNVVEDANGECFFVKTAFNLRVLLNACSALRYPSTTDIHAAAVTVPACNKNRKVCINTVAYVFSFVRKTDAFTVPRCYSSDRMKSQCCCVSGMAESRLPRLINGKPSSSGCVFSSVNVMTRLSLRT